MDGNKQMEVVFNFEYDDSNTRSTSNTRLKTTLANPKTLPITKEVFRSLSLKSQIFKTRIKNFLGTGLTPIRRRIIYNMTII